MLDAATAHDQPAATAAQPLRLAGGQPAPNGALCSAAQKGSVKNMGFDLFGARLGFVTSGALPEAPATHHEANPETYEPKRID